LEEYLLQFIRDHHLWTYPLIFAWTFVEGETIVLLCAAAAGDLGIPVELLALTAFAGSFAGDQLYFTIGRRYGMPLLNRWPKLEHKIDWAFHYVHNHPVMFILSFRFVYGVRNFAPFVIGIADVPRSRYMALNFIAAMIWAHSFAWGGAWLGKALERWLGDAKWFVLLGVVVLALAIYGITRYRKRCRSQQAKNEAQAKAEAHTRQQMS
jgi:membrane protein DedA with SNARE-associated domain